MRLSQHVSVACNGVLCRGRVRGAAGGYVQVLSRLVYVGSRTPPDRPVSGTHPPLEPTPGPVPVPIPSARGT